MGMGVVAGIVLMLSSIAQSAHQVREPDLLLFEEALVVLTVVFLADKLFKLIEAVRVCSSARRSHGRKSQDGRMGPHRESLRYRFPHASA